MSEYIPVIVSSFSFEDVN